MYYSNGNYEAFARPKKPQDVENKSAYLVGSGLASLSAALFLVRDAQMPGERIHILEELELPGGSLDGILDNTRGYIMRGGREMENHFECLWDLFRSVPSLEVKDASVLDEFYWLNKEDPNFSKMRATMNRGKSAHTDGKFTLTDKAAEEIARLFLTSEEELNDKRISDVFSEEFFQSNFWLYWRTMFAFEEWHSAMEMRRYIARFIHHIGGLPDLSALKFTRYNQYESLVMPLVKHLESKGVRFEYGVQVKNVIVSKAGGKKTATKIVYEKGGREGEINLTENDLVFVTNGSITENSTYGDQNTVPVLDASLGGSWSLWTNIAVQDPAFGKPEKFCGNIKESNFVSATLTTLDGRIPPYIERICQRDPFAGKVVTGGIVSVKDSSWLMSWTLNRQQQFRDQPKDQLCVWVYGLFPDKPGNYIKKPMTECTGEEICQEWLYHMGVPTDKIEALAKSHANTVPVMMPYITAFFMPRSAGDRPDVVPDGAVNFAFLGQFAETPRDTIFTTEYSMRTGMEAVYTLLDIDRGVPEVWGSTYDVRDLLNAAVQLRDGKPLSDLKMNWIKKFALGKAVEKVQDTDLGRLLLEYKII